LSFKTRQQQVAAKRSGRIKGHFGKVSVGRPQAAIEVNLPMNATTKEIVGRSKKSGKATCINWSLPESFAQLKQQVIGHIRAKEANKSDDENTGIIPSTTTLTPRTTLQRHSERFLEVAKEKNQLLEFLTSQMIFPKCRGGGNGLLNDNEVELLAETVKHRDEANNGMSRNEAIQLVMELAQMTNRTTAEGHCDHLVRQKRLRGVKNFGRTVKAQATASKRGRIAVEQQLHRHATLQEALDFQREVNEPTNEQLEVEDFFFGNLDETCLMAKADGSVRVIASAWKKKTKKNMDDSRASITSLRIGPASGTQGPFAFLAKGTQMDRKSITRLPKEQCPAGSQVVMLPSACMTDETWLKSAPMFTKGKHALEVVKDHPDWWMTLTCNGFGSHAIDRANKIFAECKMSIVNEEGDASQVSQSHDQQVAKKNKSC